MSTAIELARKLFDAGLISSMNAELLPLTGGVSSDIYRVTDQQKTFVAKQALSQLKVAAHWQADLSRNNYEQRYLKYVGNLLPDIVPQVLAADEQAGFFTMEYLGDGFRNWKQQLLSGLLDNETVLRVTTALAKIHNLSRHDPKARSLFDSDRNFLELRIAPYFYPLAEQFPELSHRILSCCERLQHCKEALVHGDFSPKNMLVKGEQNGTQQIVILDCEVAWYGDPAFDVAFLISHLLLKQYHLHREDYAQAALLVHQQYQKLTEQDLSDRLLQLIPMLLLARVAGKSPVEYLDDNDRVIISARSRHLIEHTPDSVESLINYWITQTTHENR